LVNKGTSKNPYFFVALFIIWAAYRAFALTALVPRAVIGSIAAAAAVLRSKFEFGWFALLQKAICGKNNWIFFEGLETDKEKDISEVEFLLSPKLFKR